MTPESQRIAIAEAYGWKDGHRDESTRNQCRWKHPNGIHFAPEPPDYLNDLNAMHEAHQTLTYVQRQEYHRHLLGDLWNLTTDDLDKCTNATAAQRAEAFLRTIGKWVD